MFANSRQFAVGFSALLVGLMEYVFSRPADSTYLGKMIGALAGDFPFRIEMFGIFGGILPEYVHAFSFALITMAIFPRAVKKVRGAICLFWLVVELFFEIGQYFGQQIAGYIPKAFDHIFMLDNLKSYFVNGTYDHLDVLAICLGITAAYITGELTTQGGKDNDSLISMQRESQDAALETGT
ncbi:MAG: hypothetical protein HWN51_03415 [Desulfobacterales bacterium]|nr:hypothetical protein [Desulfobacterales bacterium]